MGPSEKHTKSNYDRWKPGTKLACMMALKRVSANPDYFDPATQKYTSSTWHSVAESLNKEYPDYAKRFTNVNVKDRYDRVMKHHKVFRRMAHQMSGFVWNPELFCFDNDDALLKEYEHGIRNDDFIKQDINVAKFLCKAGHIDIEYYHRYIHQMADDDELRNDSILNSPSFIEDAISKGILRTLSSRPSFFKESSISGSSKTSSSLPTSTSSGSATSATTGSSSMSGTSNDHIPSLSQNSSISHHPSDPNHSTPIILPQPNHLSQHAQPPQQHPQSHQHQQQQHQVPLPHPPQQQQQQQPQMHHVQHHLATGQPPNLPMMGMSHPVLQGPTMPPHIPHHSHQSTASSTPAVQHDQQLAGHPGTSSDLDFSVGLMDANQGPMMPQLSMMPMGPGNPAGAPPGMGSTSSNDSNSHHLQPHQHQQGHIHQGTTMGPRKKMVLSLPASLMHIGSIAENYENATTTFGPDGKILNNSTGEALIQIHKEFEMMKSVVNEQILNLRVNKLISYDDFQAIQEIEENNVPFIRSAYKRLNDDGKLIELIGIYLNQG